MKYKILIPGKTFCFGEYAALVGGPALLMTTRPGFEIVFSETATPQENPFHPQSPAGSFYNQHRDFFSQWKLEFKDYYSGAGGFGASTAQFLGLSLFKRSIETQLTTEKLVDVVSKDYEQTNLRLNPELALARQPSGYDLRAQCLGGAVVVKKDSGGFVSKAAPWPFADLSFLIVPTGFKVATHTHLRELQGDSLNDLAKASDSLVTAWDSKNQSSFFQQMELWNQSLGVLGLVHSRTVELLNRLRTHREIMFAKGCGALGADILFLVFKHPDQEKIRTILSEMRLNEAYAREDLWKNHVKVLVE